MTEFNLNEKREKLEKVYQGLDHYTKHFSGDGAFLRGKIRMLEELMGKSFEDTPLEIVKKGGRE